jgi:hypothetical protein
MYEKLAKTKNMPKKESTAKDSPTRAPVDSNEKNDISSPSDEISNDILPSGNLDAAFESAGVDLVVEASTGAEPGVPAQKVVYVRVSEGKHVEWAGVADGRGVSLSEFVRSCVDPVVDSVLRCVHPKEFRQAYAWQETCLKCGKRLRG